MAKSKSIHPISGKLREHVYVDSKDGYIVRSGPKKGAAKKRCSLCLMAKPTALTTSMVLPDNRYVLLKQLERMEVNERYPLHKLGGARLKLTPKANKIEITVEVDYHPPSSVAKRTVNCYEYQILFVHLNKDAPKEVVLEDKTSAEQLCLLAQLNDKDRSTVLSIFDTMLTKQKFQEFFQQNIPAQ
ncbi:hypothetical protein LZZ85_04070 [Terrimonas sp. NA20]|uniref:Uncharacterized protein n=1 Tax=Terrimonas ginsenosidimutans TaxID=2908004 RepID=A0ABS9KMA3_9BACT|nr:hypothetical protein [Terrimonas ginsenosidimutans]MCG2613439.1 hypothetical protein [Terrimonas ginsenosidimutans]